MWLRPLLALGPTLLPAFFLAVAFGRGAIDYFVIYPERPEVAEAFNTRLAAAGQFLAASSEWRDGQDQIFVTNRFVDDRASIATFLRSDPDVVQHQVGGLRDAWYE